MAVLVTGGAGYIGSHAVQRLLRESAASGTTVVSFDNNFRGHRSAMERLAGTPEGKNLRVVEGDIADRAMVARVLIEHGVDTVMHFAALAYVGESVDDPLRYYHNNVTGLVGVLGAMDDAAAATGREVARFVFSSSCSTYGEIAPERMPIREEYTGEPVSPYGRTKLIGEKVLADYAVARERAKRPLGLVFLRYFNVCGSDRTGLIGEDHTPETHLIPVVLECAMGQRPSVAVFGTDYPTPDGTCVRDYVHVEDLIAAHVLAMRKVKPGEWLAYNVGIGRGYSVREIIAAAERVTGKKITVVEQARRAGDPPMAYAQPEKITRELGWKPEVAELDEIIRSAWDWMRRHPRGYGQKVLHGEKRP